MANRAGTLSTMHTAGRAHCAVHDPCSNTGHVLARAGPRLQKHEVTCAHIMSKLPDATAFVTGRA
eukprot:561156-Lingulodinium_polyedra.AAC.1